MKPSALLTLILLCAGYLFLCPLDASWCSLRHTADSRHPVLCFGAINFLLHRELFPSTSVTRLGTMVNGDYGADSAIGWTSIVTLVALAASILLYFMRGRKEPLILAAPLIGHWLCLFVFFNILNNRCSP